MYSLLSYPNENSQWRLLCSFKVLETSIRSKEWLPGKWSWWCHPANSHSCQKSQMCQWAENSFLFSHTWRYSRQFIIALSSDPVFMDWMYVFFITRYYIDKHGYIFISLELTWNHSWAWILKYFSTRETLLSDLYDLKIYTCMFLLLGNNFVKHNAIFPR